MPISSEDITAWGTRITTTPEIPADFSNQAIPGSFFPILMACITYTMIIVAVFGIMGNTLIIIAFIKIGFSESINISYCALSISDFLCIAAFSWNAVCYIPEFSNSDLPFIAREVVVPTGGALSQIFGGTTAWITAFISLERCLCVVFPLKTKDIVKSKRTVIIILTIFVVGTTPLTCLTFSIYVFEEKFDETRNRSLITVDYRNSSFIDQLMDFNFIYTMIFTNTIPLIIILVCSIALVIKLSQSASWRRGNSSANCERNKNFSHRQNNKELRVIKTVLAIAAAFILPGSLSSLRYLIAVGWPVFRPIGAYSQYYRTMARVGFLLSLMNSSVNFLIYFQMGSKFRQIVNNMFCKQTRH